MNFSPVAQLVATNSPFALTLFFEGSSVDGVHFTLAMIPVTMNRSRAASSALKGVCLDILPITVSAVIFEIARIAFACVIFFFLDYPSLEVLHSSMYFILCN